MQQPSGRRRHRQPPCPQRGTTDESPPAALGAPPPPSEDGTEREPLPEDHVRIHCASRGSKPTGKMPSPANVRRSPPEVTRTTLCPGVWPPVRHTTTPGATSDTSSNICSLLPYVARNCCAVLKCLSCCTA